MTGAVIIPAYNEEATIAEVIGEVRVVAPELDIIVVNDRSTDGTAAVLATAGVIQINLAVNLGAWAATQAGLRYAVTHDYDFVVTMDADGQHLPSTLPALISRFAEDPEAIVVGECVRRGSRSRRFAWRYFRAITGLSVQDLTSGLRVYGREAIKLLSSREATMLEYQDVGVLLLLRRHGFDIHEVSIEMQERAVGGSHVFRTWLSVLYYMVYTSIMSVAKVNR
ncbi:MAG: glycosyltransferase family 2 protein [Halieaceae bacterium]